MKMKERKIIRKRGIKSNEKRMKKIERKKGKENDKVSKEK